MKLPFASARDRRALMLGAAILIALAFITRGYPAWRDWTGRTRAAATELSSELSRAEASIAAASMVRDSLRARKARFLAIAPTLVAGDSPGGAAAALASLVSGAAATSGLRVGALQLRADTVNAGFFVRVGVRGDVVGDVSGVSRFIAALEQGPTMLRVREISIAQPEPAAAPDRPEALRVAILVEGLALNRTRERVQ